MVDMGLTLQVALAGTGRTIRTGPVLQDHPLPATTKLLFEPGTAMAGAMFPRICLRAPIRSACANILAPSAIPKNKKGRMLIALIQP